MKTSSVLRTSVIVFIFLIGAKLLNFFKKILIGNLFGVSWVADSFFAASYLPYYLAIFFEGVLFLGFLPLFAQVSAEKGEEEAKRFVSQTLILITLLTGFLVVLSWFFAPRIIHEIVPGFKADKQGLSVSLFQILSLVIVFISLTSFFKALNSYFEHYAVAASSALVDTAVMIGITLISWKVWGIHGAAWASVIGVMTALVFQAAFFFRKHPFLPKKFSFEWSWFKKLSLFLIPMGLIWGFQQIPLVILNRFGSGMWQGTISALAISQALTTVPMGLVSHTVLFAVFPSLAKQASGETPENAKETFFQTLRGGFFILIPVGFLLTALARPFGVLFFGGGGILEEGTERIANSLACFGWATFALYADLFMTQSLIAIRKTLPAILLCASRAVLTYGIGYVLSTWWDYQGLAFSFSLALVINLFVLFPFFFQWSPFQGKWTDLFRYFAKIALASSPLLLGAWLTNHWSVSQWMDVSKMFLTLGLVLGVLVGLTLYTVLLSWLRVEEMRSLFVELKKGWTWKSWWLVEQSE